MNKFFCALAILCLIVPCAFADVDINAVNFPHNIFRAYISKTFDSNNDNILSNSEISAVTSIDVSDMGITNLSGIKNFTSLKYLICRENGLTNLDVSDMESLKTVYCGSNSITTLDVTGCINLRNLSCYNNSLSDLDVRDLSALRYLSCGRNNLSTIDISKNAALGELMCYRNNLSTLDVSKNAALRYLDCDDNNLSALNLQNNEALTSLSCENNQIEELDLSSNTALSMLYCKNNQIMILDLDNNTVLAAEDIRISQQNIGELKIKQDSEGYYCVDLANDYGFTSENLSYVDQSSIELGNGSNFVDYDADSGIARFTSSPTSFCYEYDTGRGVSMPVKIFAVPQITTTELDMGYVNRRYSFKLAGVGAGTLSWSINNENYLPEGINFYKSSGTFLGSPKKEGRYPFIITLTNTIGSVSKDFTIEVKSASDSPESPTIATQNSDIPLGYVNTRYSSFRFSAQNSSGASWYIDEGEIPGLTLSTGGYLTGTPAQAGSFDITIKAVNSKGGSDTKTFTITINPEISKPVITTYRLPNGVIGQQYFVQLEADGYKPITWTITSGNLPKGLSITSSTITGIPTESGSFRITLQASNSVGSASKSFNMYIADTGTPQTPKILAAEAVAAAEVVQQDLISQDS